MIVVATDEEYALAKERFSEEKILKTGVGGVNVVRTLRDLDKNEEIFNFGYAGSNTLPVGTEVYVRESFLSHPGVEYEEPSFLLNLPEETSGVKCYTSNDFVTETDIKDPVVFDMELAFIMALGFNKVTSLKIVSDNLNFGDYTNNIKA